ncbi:energy-coupling factor ABC transporter ATP-binding protein [Pseudonocardia sp. T1-2H]|uniref:energy-coupling factor ABC transporter ATP-binding protein n=1 Tax=Pseudonocardia sp. T1-2H TaxID=3128899 RepID=UPI003101A64D
MSGTPLLEGRALAFAYERGRPVLDGAQITVHAGRRIAVLGPNGGGKTTLFRLLVGLLEPTSGQVLLDGEPLVRSRRGLTRLRKQVQLVLQDPDDQLFAADVTQDVSFGPVNMGLPAADVEARVAAALDALDITDLADRPTHLLSFGQRKRVSVAGAIAMCPRLLVLDEPTAGLDPAGVEALMEIITGLHRAGTTIVLSTHDVDLAYRWADEVAVVASGTVRSAGVDEALGDPELLRSARLGPAWAPGVHRLLRELGSEDRPRTAAELSAVVVERLGRASR